MSTHAIRAVVGARVSYVQGDEKTSHVTQRSKGEAYAESQSWSVVGAFEDLDVSAIKLSPWERPDLKEWLTDRSGEWDALIFAKTDRVFRSANDCVKLAEWCKVNRKILVLVDDGIKLDYYSPEDAKDAFAGAMSKVFLILASVFAEIEGQRFVQRARDRVAFLRTTDRWGYGIPPYGFRVVDHPSGTGKALDHDAEAQKVLAGVVTHLLAGGSLTGITASLNDDGVLSPRDHLRARAGRPTRGNRWTVDKLKGILSNPSTQGIKTANGKPVLDASGEPVRVGPESFDPVTWQRVQQELAQRSQDPRKRRHTTNPLLGVAKCAGCGKNMRQRSQTTPRVSDPRCRELQEQVPSEGASSAGLPTLERHVDGCKCRGGVTHRYYVCGRSPACPGVSIIADHAEELVEQAFLESHAGRRVVSRVWRAGSDHSAELEQTKQTIESLREDRAMGLFTTPEDELMFRQQMKALIAKRDALEEMPVQRAGWVDVYTDQTYAEVWPTANTEERRKLLTDAGVVITITRPNVYEVHTDLGKLLGEAPTAQREEERPDVQPR